MSQNEPGSNGAALHTQRNSKAGVSSADAI